MISTEMGTSQKFSNAMTERGLACPYPLIADAKIHRYQIPGDKSGSKNGWYEFYEDGNPTVVFGSWKTGEKYTESTKNPKDLSPLEQQQHRRRVAQALQEAEQERQRIQNEAALQARVIWNQAIPAPGDFPYLTKKQIKPHGSRLYHGRLVIPLIDAVGTIISLQFIAKDGRKQFHTGGSLVGNFFPMGEPESVVYLVEGFSTGATIYEVCGLPVVVAFTPGNLKPVALHLRQKYPKSRIILAADNDTFTTGNPGLTKAKEAAEAVNGIVVFPTFKEQGTNGDPPSDFNDLSRLEGAEVAHAQLSVTSYSEAETWPDLVSLEDHDLTRLPAGLFPPWLDCMIEGVSQSTDTPRELAATLGLAVLATACQRTFDVNPEGEYTEPLYLWCIAGMEPGNRKTAVLNAMTAPLISYEREQEKSTAEKRRRVEVERNIREAHIKHQREKAAKEDIEDKNLEIEIQTKLHWLAPNVKVHYQTVTNITGPQHYKWEWQEGIVELVDVDWQGAVIRPRNEQPP